ncbi:hypothetical protein ACFL0F_00260 [Patescibacteria group bacterium]
MNIKVTASWSTALCAAIKCLESHGANTPLRWFREWSSPYEHDNGLTKSYWFLFWILGNKENPYVLHIEVTKKKNRKHWKLSKAKGHTDPNNTANKAEVIYGINTYGELLKETLEFPYDVI